VRIVARLLRRPLRLLGYAPIAVSPDDRPREVTVFDSPLESIYSRSEVVFHVPIERCSNLYFQRYGPADRNPYVKTVRDYLTGTHRAYEGSALYHYYERCRSDIRTDPYLEFIGTLAELDPRLSSPLTDGTPLPFPWDPASLKGQESSRPATSAEPLAHRLYPHDKARENFSRLTTLLESIEEHGYRPSSSPEGEIQGYFLRDRDAYRFIVRAGMHRTAVLSALGRDQIRATFRAGEPRTIDLTDLENWPQVRSGFYEPRIARMFFSRYFSLPEVRTEPPAT
jgi:hypothetical protein